MLQHKSDNLQSETEDKSLNPVEDTELDHGEKLLQKLYNN